MNSSHKSVDTSVSVQPRKRPGKALRGMGSLSANIGVYRAENASPSARVVNLSSAQGQIRGERAKSAAAASANNQRSAGRFSRNQVAFAVAGSLCVVGVALAGASWPKLSEDKKSRVLDTRQSEVTAAISGTPTAIPLPPDIVVEDITQQPSSIAVEEKLQQPPALVIEEELQQPPAIAEASAEEKELVGEYIAEIDHLRVVNTELKIELEDLTQEAVDLNEELLALELREASRIQVVYNFVNDPSGASTSYASSNENYNDSASEEYYDEDAREDYYDESLVQQDDIWDEENADDSTQYGAYTDEYNGSNSLQQDPYVDPYSNGILNEELQYEADYQYDTDYVFDYDEEVNEAEQLLLDEQYQLLEYQQQLLEAGQTGFQYQDDVYSGGEN